MPGRHCRCSSRRCRCHPAGVTQHACFNQCSSPATSPFPPSTTTLPVPASDLDCLRPVTHAPLQIEHAARDVCCAAICQGAAAQALVPCWAPCCPRCRVAAGTGDETRMPAGEHFKAMQSIIFQQGHLAVMLTSSYQHCCRKGQSCPSSARRTTLHHQFCGLVGASAMGMESLLQSSDAG